MNNTYSYSAKEAEEAKRIRRDFSLEEKSDLEKLRELEATAKRKASIPAMIVGVISALVFGVGFSCVMVFTTYFVLGIFVGIIGVIGMALAYFVYVKKLEKEKLRVATEVERLSSLIISGTVCIK